MLTPVGMFCLMNPSSTLRSASCSVLHKSLLHLNIFKRIYIAPNLELKIKFIFFELQERAKIFPRYFDGTYSIGYWNTNNTGFVLIDQRSGDQSSKTILGCFGGCFGRPLNEPIRMLDFYCRVKETNQTGNVTMPNFYWLFRRPIRRTVSMLT